MAKAPVLLVAMAICCRLLTVEAFSGCHCLGSIKRPIPFRVIKKIEMFQISGHCRWPETILTRRNGSKICIDPNQDWFKALLNKMQVKMSVSTANSTSSDLI